MKTIRNAMMALALAGSAAGADAATFDFSYSGLPFFGGSVEAIAHGTIEATGYGDTYFIDSVSGFRGSDAITGYDIDDFAQSFDFSNGVASDIDLEYSIGDTSYEVRYPGSGVGSEFAIDASGLTTSRVVTAFSLTPHVSAPSVPEPATWLMMISAFGMTGGLARRSRKRPAASLDGRATA